jgi:hypothetical protein
MAADKTPPLVLKKFHHEELKRFLSHYPQFSAEEREAMAATFSQYDREIQEEFLRNLPDIDKQDKHG